MLHSILSTFSEILYVMQNVKLINIYNLYFEDLSTDEYFSNHEELCRSGGEIPFILNHGIKCS